MDIKRLAAEAQKVFAHVYSMPYGDHRKHGMEYARGWFNIFNEEAGQSRVVLFHPESGYIFKPHGWNEPDDNSSRKVLGTCVLDGEFYTIRLPEYHVVDDIQVAENVPCNTCCPSQTGWCEHSKVIEVALGGADAHAGNYRIVGNEVILIDFEYLGVSD